MAKRLVPCIWLDDNAEEAALMYTRTFADSRVVLTSHYPENRDNPAKRPRGSVLTVEVELAGDHPLVLLNGGPELKPNPSISLFARCANAAEVDRVAKALAEGGKELMPLGAYPWSDRYAWVQDRYGLTWQVIAQPRGEADAAIAPCLMFANDKLGQAEGALKEYVGAFRGNVIALERYGAGEGPEGKIKHGRVSIAGSELIAMDAPGTHAFTFDEGVSLMVRCDDQRAIDHYWTTLVEGGGEHGPCGWLKDRYGVSWQVAPVRMDEWLTEGTQASRDRVFEAMLHMKKLDIAALERAAAG